MLFPLAFAEFDPADPPRRGLRQVLDGLDLSGILVGRKASSRSSARSSSSGSAASAGSTKVFNHFTAGLVGNADDTGLFCGRMPEKGLLDLPGPHAIARGDDHVVLPGLEPQVPLVVLPDEVAGEIPLAAGLRRRRLGAVPELGENDAVVVGSDGDLTDLVVG